LADDHLRVIAKVERVVRERETLAVAMPRGSGKTNLCLPPSSGPSSPVSIRSCT